VKFDHAFNSKASQGDIYGKLVDVVPRITDGYNVTIFAYGQTGSGKTHTMFGEGY
jgi:chromosomal replication initiation ATPase DnaA